MAIFTEDGRLATIQTTDLINLLSALDEHDQIEMHSSDACLGARTVLLLLGADAPYDTVIEYGIYSCDVRGKDEQYTIEASPAVGEFIGNMLSLQDQGGNVPLTVGTLRRELDKHIDAWVEVRGWQEAL